MKTSPHRVLLQVVVLVMISQPRASTNALPQQQQAVACSVPQQTLSFACNNACSDAFTPCLLNSTTPTSSSSLKCAYECLDKVYVPAAVPSFVLLVPFGTRKSPNETTGPVTTTSASEANQPDDDTKSYTSISNDQLARIDTLKLRSTTTAVLLLGGNSILDSFSRGQVTTVALAPDLLTTQSQVSVFMLRSLNLQPIAANLSVMLPDSIAHLAVNNALLTDFPTGLSPFLLLRRLSLTYNYISSVNASMRLPSVTELDLQGNEIASFTAVFSNLRVLDLGMNRLTEVPRVMAEHVVLSQLFLNNNSIVEVNKTHELQSLTLLDMSSNRIKRFDARFSALQQLCVTSDLSSNELQAIPPIVFNYTKLTTLRLTGNTMTSATLTNAQALFISKLTNFTFDESSISKNCEVKQQRDVHGMKFCVTNDLVKSDIDSDPDDEDGPPIFEHVLLGIVCGMLALAVVAGGFVAWDKRRKAASHDHSSINASLTGDEDRNMVAAASTRANAAATTYSSKPKKTKARKAKAKKVPISTKSELEGVLKSEWSTPEALVSINRVNADAIMDVEPIDKGATTEMWLVKYRNTQLLVSKRLKKPSDSQNQAFIAEISLAARLEHSKIVQFVGVAWTNAADIQALFEYMDGGDLRSYLKSSGTPHVWTLEKVQIAIDIAEALSYAHSLWPPVVHRDLKSRNVLLSKEMKAKVTGFGVFQCQSEATDMTSLTPRGVESARWLGPEVHVGERPDRSTAADVFSFGAILCEMATHALPYEDVIGTEGDKLAHPALLKLMASGKLKPSPSDSCLEKIAELANECLSLNPVYRPSASELTYSLRNIKRELAAGGYETSRGH